MYYRSFRAYALGQGLDLAEQARLFAKFGLSSGDALINCWESKAHWSNWRPHHCDPPRSRRWEPEDGRRRHLDSADWYSALPDVASGYNCATASFMKAAQLYFGRERTLFTLVHPTGMTREYGHFLDVVDDTIDARVYQGIHFRTADEVGATLGRRVARWVDGHALERVRHQAGTGRNLFRRGPPRGPLRVRQT